MLPTDRELMQQALEALEFYTCGDEIDEALITALKERLAQPDRKLWLWKNFEDGRPEYWAFDNPYPTNLEDGDPQTLGQPCGYAIFKQSRDGSFGRTEAQVLREMKNAKSPQHRDWVGLTEEEKKEALVSVDPETKRLPPGFRDFASAIEAKLKEKNT